jgi:DNA-binding response OmpR family regulator
LANEKQGSKSVIRIPLVISAMSKETILILDKEFHTQWTLKTLLETEQFIVLAVDAIERTLQNFQEFEVSGLIAEYRIGNTSTPEIIWELKKNFPELYVMMVTDENLGEEEYMRIMSSGIDDFFVKPISAEKILIHLKKGLRQRRILLQKKFLEQRLNEMKTNGGGQEVAFSRGSPSLGKSFTAK